MQFNLNTFRFLADLNLANGWNNFSLEDLKGYTDELQAEGMEEDMPMVFKAVRQTEKFINAIAPNLVGDEPATQVISGQSEQGVLVKVGGPKFYRGDEDTIILRVGKTSYTTDINGDKITIGKVKGSISVNEKTNADGKKVVNDKTGLPSLEVTAKLMIVGDRGADAEAFYVPFMLDMEQEMTDIQVEGSLEDGELHTFLSEIPKGGTTFIDLRMLPQGDFPVSDVSDPKVNQWEDKDITSWNIVVPGLGIVSSRGKDLEGQLAGSYKIHQKKARTKGITLRISKHDVEYRTQDGEKKVVPYPMFLMDLKNGNVKNLPDKKIGNSDVKHYINAGLIDCHSELQDFAIASVGHVREILGLNTPAALPAVSVAAELPAPVAMKSAAVAVVDEEDPDNIPF
jgi:hypothetical protein